MTSKAYGASQVAQCEWADWFIPMQGPCTWPLGRNYLLQEDPLEKEMTTQSSIFVVQSLSLFWLFVTPLTAACQASLSFTMSQILFRFKSIESEILYSSILAWKIPCTEDPDGLQSTGSQKSWTWLRN